ncbi:MAG: transglycosylase SLT domain-containing protein [Clostridiales bacterium]|nr:transglycosylase SLT domain-containing protein [Clostridiales bacterium]MBQ1572612.1 transglycosylase SLT domain-containing protein [Clostridiales bacterium]
MKRVVAGILAGLCILTQPITASANSLSYIVPEEVDGIPTEISQNAEIIGHEFNICPELLEAIAYYESSYQATAKNGPCMGLMQVNAHIHKDRFTEAGWSEKDWDDAYKNMFVAASYLHDLFVEYEDVAEVLYRYNGDTTNLERYHKSGYLSHYVQAILNKSEELERQHGK